MGKTVKILIGAILCLIGLFTIMLWWNDVWVLVRGSVGFGFILLGMLFFAVASD
jgi:hypothetical protein